jgi:hypothetical protein
MERKQGTHYLWNKVSRNFKADHFFHEVELQVSGRSGTIKNFTMKERGS